MNIDKKIEEARSRHVIDLDDMHIEEKYNWIKQALLEVQKETAREMMINRHYVSDYEWEKYKDAYKQITGEEYEK